MDKRPIGIFDSGVGGLTVLDKVSKLLPGENIIYFGDTARVPYGNKSKETITRFSKEIVKFLLKFNVKLIVVACNTVSSLSLEALRKVSKVPVIGVIKPGVREALKVSKNKRIGVIGTEATISSLSYKNEIKSNDAKVVVIQKACPLFVGLAESRWLGGDITERIAKRYLSSILAKRIDTLILGCTHYPLLKKAIKKVVGKKVKLIDSSVVTAKYVKAILEEEDLVRPKGTRYVKFFASDDTRGFEELAGIFLGKKIKAKKAVL